MTKEIYSSWKSARQHLALSLQKFGPPLRHFFEHFLAVSDTYLSSTELLAIEGQRGFLCIVLVVVVNKCERFIFGPMNVFHFPVLGERLFESVFVHVLFQVQHDGRIVMHRSWWFPGGLPGGHVVWLRFRSCAFSPTCTTPFDRVGGMALDRRTVIWMCVTFGRRVSSRGWLRRLISTLVSTFTWTSVQNRHVDRPFSHWIEGKGGRIPRCMVLLRPCLRSPRTRDSYSPFHPTAGESCQRNQTHRRSGSMGLEAKVSFLSSKATAARFRRDRTGRRRS